MKRLNIAIAALLMIVMSCVLLLNGCRLNTDLVNATPENSGNVSDKTPDGAATPDAGATEGPSDGTEAPDDHGDANASALAFANRYKGTWTADDNTFLDFDVDGDKAFVLFGLWASDGDFPVYDIVDALSDPENENKNTIKVRERSSDKESELIVTSTDDSISVSEPGSIIGVKKYTYDGARQFPPEVFSLTQDEIVVYLGGHWVGYKDPEEFTVIEAAADGSAVLRHGHRSAPGEEREYTFKSAAITDKLGYDFDIVLIDRDSGQELSTQAGLRQAANILLLNFLDGRGTVSFEEYKETELTDIDPVEFANQYKGAWTNSEDEFIQYSVSAGKAYMLFAIWNAGGEFPSGQITKVTRIGAEKKYEIVLKMNFDGAVHVYFMEMEDATGKMTVWEDGQSGSDYYYIESKQPAQLLPEDEIMSNFGGLWFSESDPYEFIYIENVNSDSVNFTHGCRNNDAAFDYETIESAVGDSVGHDFQVTFKKAGSDVIIVRYVGIYQAGQKMLIDLNDGKGERPFIYAPLESLMELGRAYTAGMFNGCWTAANMSDFIWFSAEDGEGYLMFAVWYSGGSFPVGRIVNVTTLTGGASEGVYMLVLRMNDTGELKVYNVKPLPGYKIEFWEEGGAHGTYTYYADKQMGMG